MNTFSKIILTVQHGGMSIDTSMVFKTSTHEAPTQWRKTGTQYMNLRESAIFADPSATSCHQVGASFNWHSKKFQGTLKQRIQANCLDLVSSVNGITSIGEVIDTPESLTIIAPTWRLDAVKQ